MVCVMTWLFAYISWGSTLLWKPCIEAYTQLLTVHHLYRFVCCSVSQGSSESARGDRKGERYADFPISHLFMYVLLVLDTTVYEVLEL